MEVAGQQEAMKSFKLEEGGKCYSILTSRYSLIIRDKESCLSSFNTPRRITSAQPCSCDSDGTFSSPSFRFVFAFVWIFGFAFPLGIKHLRFPSTVWTPLLGNWQKCRGISRMFHLLVELSKNPSANLEVNVYWCVVVIINLAAR